MNEKALRIVAPLGIGLLLLAGWETLVLVRGIPPYILPAPSLVATTMVAEWSNLWPSLMITLQITTIALIAAIVGGGGLAILFSMWRLVELSLFPYAVILQVTPIVAIAPLILIYAPSTQAALMICAWLVAFFPVRPTREDAAGRNAISGTAD